MVKVRVELIQQLVYCFSYNFLLQISVWLCFLLAFLCISFQLRNAESAGLVKNRPPILRHPVRKPPVHRPPPMPFRPGKRD